MVRPKRATLLGALALLLALAAVVACVFGSVKIPVLQVIEALVGGAVRSEYRDIILQVRIPRVLVAGLVGGGLAISGAAMQGLFRNPMADPGIIGVSSGGALGGVLSLALGLSGFSLIGLPAMAFLGALGAALAVYAIARKLGGGSTPALLLTGLAVSAFLGALVSLVVTFTVNNQDVLREMIYWLTGGLEARAWRHVAMAGPPVLLGSAVLVRYGRELNLLALGDEEAQALGVHVAAVRRWVLVASALVAGSAVSVSGVIGFVGLVVPHMLRVVGGPDQQTLLPASALGGATFLILADTIARIIVRPAEIRVGIITACAGAPFFLWMLFRNRRRMAAQL